MDENSALLAFAALSQATRLEVFRLLMTFEPEGLAAGEIARRVAVPQNTMSTHLAVLSRAGLVAAERRSRSIIYRASVSGLRDLIDFLGDDCCGGNPQVCAALAQPSAPAVVDENAPLPERVYEVLFLCTGNSARSIMAESILRQEGAGRFNVYSAGSRPEGVVAPEALEVLAHYDYATEGLHSKSWEEFTRPGAPQMDFVFTVCNAAAGEACPAWPGRPITAHWGIADPTTVEGQGLARKTAFNAAFRFLQNRITAFTALPIAKIDRMTLGHRLSDIGRLAGTTGL